MRHVDVTIDFETCSIAANAAVLQMAAVVWNREAECTDELIDFARYGVNAAFNRSVDLRSCVFDGFVFDQSTCKWWAEQDERLKKSILESSAHNLKDVMCDFLTWIAEVKSKTNASTLCLWSQGADFDIAIMKNICSRYGLSVPVKHTFFRDARTIIAEIGGRYIAKDIYGAVADNNKVYDMLPSVKIEGLGKHNALYDCYRTTYNLWHCLSMLPNSK